MKTPSRPNGRVELSYGAKEEGHKLMVTDVYINKS